MMNHWLLLPCSSADPTQSRPSRASHHTLPKPPPLFSICSRLPVRSAVQVPKVVPLSSFFVVAHVLVITALADAVYVAFLFQQARTARGPGGREGRGKAGMCRRRFAESGRCKRESPVGRGPGLCGDGAHGPARAVMRTAR